MGQYFSLYLGPARNTLF